MHKKIKISAVSYLNTLPFIYGIEKNNNLMRRIELSKDIPAICADKLITGKVDLGLIPVAEISKLKKPRIISDYCIGANGKVGTVLLLGERPVSEINTVLLDYQSRTSVNLTKILIKNYFKKNPDFIYAKEGYENDIGGKTAALIIGDRAFKYKNKFEFVYDLSEIWMKYSSYPFVFAAWVSNIELDDEFIKQFNDALKNGLENIDKITGNYNKKNNSGEINIKKYLTENISYYLDSEKRKGMQLFLKLIKEL
ncbi:MAG: menaquinone biosynthesis protein [Chlorobi bacterium]|nr:menaquinone biosynthesis protein [Chlorobiota bacterium]